VFRGLKPVNWCFDCGSALAEAEVEYQDKTDLAVDVGFAFTDREQLARAFGLAALPDAPGWAVIWTTTPWTLPANQALNLHPDFEYALVSTERNGTPALLLLAKERVETCLTTWGLQGTILATCTGRDLELQAFHHPFYDRLSPVYLGEYVTLDAGTGIVHSSPAYGVEDFLSCKRYGMKDDDIINPVMGDGRYAASLPRFAGLKIWDANPLIVEAMRDAGTLVRAEKFVHSYMHCWRHKTPIIYRATNQWFAGMDVEPTSGKTLRTLALAAIEATDFYPHWGQARLHAMIANRPDWTLSRQRQWGVPMAFSSIARPANCIRARPNCSNRSPSASSAAALKPGTRSIRANCWVTTPIFMRRTGTRSMSGSIPARPTRPCCAARTPSSRPFRPISISKAATSIAAGSIRRC